MKFSDQIKRAVAECGMSRYRLSQLTGIDQPMLSRFVRGQKNLSMPALDRLAGVLRLQIVRNKQKAKKKRG
jgi:transcriptional regulator with XRE-family HTH domain